MCGVAAGIVRGIAAYYHESVAVEESACMHRGDPFCSFVVRCLDDDGQATRIARNGALVTPRATGTSEAFHPQADPGLADEPAKEPVASRIGPYRVQSLIATGGMGSVYLAHDDRLDRAVAIKVLRAAKDREPAARERFIREGKAAAAISHPHVIRVYGVGEDNGAPYLVMEYIQGLPLSSLLLPLPVSLVLRIGREIASGLAAAHDCGLVHRDIKPHNIILEGPKQRVQIIDFGLARVTNKGLSTITGAGMVVGTPAYMSPEQIDDDATVDARSDLFGLGVVLYEMLSGRVPYEGRSPVATLAAISAGNPLPLSVASPDTPPEICDLVMRLMAHRREDRPAGAHAAEAELTSLEEQFGRVVPASAPGAVAT
jgi:serine/threonine protein kinase